jgi:predicted lipoprotein with Yx(FWY)xxD motif
VVAAAAAAVAGAAAAAAAAVAVAAAAVAAAATVRSAMLHNESMMPRNERTKPMQPSAVCELLPDSNRPALAGAEFRPAE